MAPALFQIDDLHVATAGEHPPEGTVVASDDMELAPTLDEEGCGAWR